MSNFSITESGQNSRFKMTETKSHTLDVPPTDPSETWQTIPAQKQISAEKSTSINDTEPEFKYPTGLSVTLILTSVTLPRLGRRFHSHPGNYIPVRLVS
jgi:hypothetical protein